MVAIFTGRDLVVDFEENPNSGADHQYRIEYQCANSTVVHYVANADFRDVDAQGNRQYVDTLTYEENRAAGLTRTPTVRLYTQNANGKWSDPLVIQANNPQPTLPSTPTVTSTVNGVVVNITRPQDNDVAGYRIWRSDITPVALTDDNLVFDGPDTSPVIALPDSSDYFLVVAPYDSFDMEGLNVSPEISTTAARIDWEIINGTGKQELLDKVDTIENGLTELGGEVEVIDNDLEDAKAQITGLFNTYGSTASAAQSALDSEAAKLASQQARDASVTAKDIAVTAQQNAVVAQGQAETARNQAQAAQGAAEGARNAAQAEAGNALAQAQAAAGSAGTAAGHATTASNKADQAAGSASASQSNALVARSRSAGNLVSQPTFIDGEPLLWSGSFDFWTGQPTPKGYTRALRTVGRDASIGTEIPGNWAGRKIRIVAEVWSGESDYPCRVGFRLKRPDGQFHWQYASQLPPRFTGYWHHIDEVITLDDSVGYVSIVPYLLVDNFAIPATGANNISMLVSEFLAYDVTESSSAAGSANAANSAAQTATTKASEAGTSAGAANTAKIAAEAARDVAGGSAGQASIARDEAVGAAGTAAGHASNAANQVTLATQAKDAAQGSANAANTSRNEASSFAGQAGTSASSANTSSLSAIAAKEAAQLAAARNFVGDFASGLDFWIWVEQAAPTSLFYNGGFGLEGNTLSYTTNATYSVLRTKYSVDSGGTGRRWKFRTTSGLWNPNPGADPAAYAYIRAWGLDGRVYMGPFVFWTAGVNEVYPTLEFVTEDPAPFWIDLIVHQFNGPINTHVYGLAGSDITEQYNAAQSASAASTSAASAAASETVAGQQASAATTGANIATTKAGEASTSAGQAATSASNAAGSASTATSQAGIAATARQQAQDAQTAAANSASAANTSAGTAIAAQNAAGASASAADTAKLAAEAANGSAQSAASVANTKASEADGFRAASQTNATLAARYANEASKQASGNLVRQPTFEAGNRNGWEGTGPTDFWFGTSARGHFNGFWTTYRDSLVYPAPALAIRQNWSGRRLRVECEAYNLESGYNLNAGVFCYGTDGNVVPGGYLALKIANPGQSWTYTEGEIGPLPAGTVAINPWVQIQNDTPGGAMRALITYFAIYDITESKAAESSASAASGSAAVADGHRSSAASSATLAAQYRDAAQGAQGAAASSASAAAGSASAADGHRASAASQANLAANYSAEALDRLTLTWPYSFDTTGRQSYHFDIQPNQGFSGPGATWPTPFITVYGAGAINGEFGIRFKNAMPKKEGRRYRVSAYVFSYATNVRFFIGLASGNIDWGDTIWNGFGDGLPGAQNNFTPTSPGFQLIGTEFTVHGGFRGFVLPYLGIASDGGPNNGLFHTGPLLIEDITNETAAATRANAAANSASIADGHRASASSAASLSAQYRDQSQGHAQYAQSQASAAAGSAAAASGSESTTRNYVVQASSFGSQAINKNAYFATPNWNDSIPPHWLPWSSDNSAYIGKYGSNFARPNPYSPDALQMDRFNGNTGIRQTFASMAAGWYVLEADVWNQDGTWAGSGMHYNFANGSSGNLDFGLDPDTNEWVFGGDAFQNRKFSKLIHNASNAPSLDIYAMAGWEGFGSWPNRSGFARTIWHKALIRPATQQEIEARKANSTANTALGNANTALNNAAQNAAAISAESATRSDQFGSLAGRTSAVEARALAGGNLLTATTEFLNGRKEGWGQYSFGGANVQYLMNAAGSFWHPPGEHILSMYQSGSQNLGTSAGGTYQTDSFPVTGGTWIQHYVLAASHRANMQTFLEFYNADGNLIEYSFSPLEWHEGGGRNLSGYKQVGVPSFRVPDAAVTARFNLRKYDTFSGQGDSYGWFLRPYVGQARQGQTEWNPFQHSTGQATQRTVEARVTTTEGAVADINGAAAFTETVVAVSGSNPAIMSLKAGRNGSAINLTGDRIVMRNQVNGQVVEVAKFEGGVAQLNNAMIRRLRVAPRSNSQIFLPVMLRPIIRLGSDGQWIAYQNGESFGANPERITPDLNGLPALAQGESYDIRAINVGPTGFTAYAKKITASEPATQTAGAGDNVGSIPQWRSHKPTGQDAYNGNYQFTFTVSGDLISSEPLPGGGGQQLEWRAVGDIYLADTAGNMQKSGSYSEFWGGPNAPSQRTLTVTVTSNFAVGQTGGYEFGVHPTLGGIISFSNVVYSTQTQSNVAPVGGAISWVISPPSPDE